MAGGKLAEALAEPALAGEIFEGEEARHGAGIDQQVAAGGMGQHGPRLRAEDEAAPGVGIIERLLAEAVAGEMQALRLRLVEGEGEHAVDLLEGGRHAFALEQAEQHLGIGAVDEIDAGGGQLGSERGKAVDLTVVEQGIARHRIDPGLVAAGKIDDRQAQMAEGERARHMDAGLVRAAMGDGRQHAAQHGLVRRGGAVRVAQIAGDAAQGASPLVSCPRNFACEFLG